jgi:hypothetical protein
MVSEGHVQHRHRGDPDHRPAQLLGRAQRAGERASSPSATRLRIANEGQPPRRELRSDTGSSPATPTDRGGGARRRGWWRDRRSSVPAKQFEYRRAGSSCSGHTFRTIARQLRPRSGRTGPPSQPPAIASSHLIQAQRLNWNGLRSQGVLSSPGNRPGRAGDRGRCAVPEISASSDAPPAGELTARRCGRVALLYGASCTTGRHKSAEAYRKIWMPEGFLARCVVHREGPRAPSPGPLGPGWCGVDS